MPSINLTDSEANALMFVLANAEGKGITWSLVNPLLMTIGQQLQMQKEATHGATASGAAPARGPRTDGAAERSN